MIMGKSSRRTTLIAHRHVREHIDFITPTVHFDARIIPRNYKDQDRRKKGAGFGEWGKGNDCAPKLSPRPKPVYKNLTDCANNIIPDCLRALYGIPELDPRTKLNVSIWVLTVTCPSTDS